MRRDGLLLTSRKSVSCGDLVEDGREPIDVARSFLFGDADEKRVLHALVVAPERIAGVNSALACRVDDLLRIPSDANGKLLECCLLRKHKRKPELLFRQLT